MPCIAAGRHQKCRKLPAVSKGRKGLMRHSRSGCCRTVEHDVTGPDLQRVVQSRKEFSHRHVQLHVPWGLHGVSNQTGIKAQAWSSNAPPDESSV